MLKKKLVELYASTGLTESPDSLKKSEIIDAIINARDDTLGPPSSPGRTDGASSDCLSSDDGNAAGDETDADHPNGRQLIRRATIHDVSKLTSPPRNAKNRSVSMGNILGHGGSSNILLEVNKPKHVSRRAASQLSSTPHATSVHPITRLRSRQASGPLPDVTSPPSSKTKAKGKSKQVEFSHAVEVLLRTPSKRGLKGKRKGFSCITEAESEQADDVNSQLSPRRLRSKGREHEVSKAKENQDSQATPVPNLRRRLTRKSESEEVEYENQAKQKSRFRSLKLAKVEAGTQEFEADEEGEFETSQRDQESAEEVDELVSSASFTPPPESHERRPSTRRRALRPKARRVKAVPTGDEGDDEEEVEQEGDEEGEEDGNEDDVEEGEETVAIAPKKLRSGKIIGEDNDSEEEEEEQEEETEEQEEGMEVDQESVAIDDEVDDEEGDDSESLDGGDSMDQENQEVVVEEDGKQPNSWEFLVLLAYVVIKLILLLRLPRCLFVYEGTISFDSVNHGKSNRLERSHSLLRLFCSGEIGKQMIYRLRLRLAQCARHLTGAIGGQERTPIC